MRFEIFDFILLCRCNRSSYHSIGRKFNETLLPFPGSTREEFEQGSPDGLEPRLLPSTGLREQDAHRFTFQQEIRYVRPAGPQDHGKSFDLYDFRRER